MAPGGRSAHQDDRHRPMVATVCVFYLVVLCDRAPAAAARGAAVGPRVALGFALGLLDGEAAEASSRPAPRRPPPRGAAALRPARGGGGRRRVVRAGGAGCGAARARTRPRSAGLRGRRPARRCSAAATRAATRVLPVWRRGLQRPRASTVHWPACGGGSTRYQPDKVSAGGAQTKRSRRRRSARSGAPGAAPWFPSPSSAEAPPRLLQVGGLRERAARGELRVDHRLRASVLGGRGGGTTVATGGRGGTTPTTEPTTGAEGFTTATGGGGDGGGTGARS